MGFFCNLGLWERETIYPIGASLYFIDGSTEDYFTTTDKIKCLRNHRLDVALNYQLYANDYREPINPRGYRILNIQIYPLHGVVKGEIIETNINYLGFMPNITLSIT